MSLSYPNFSVGFIIHTDTIKTSPGEVISQKGKHIALYLQKLTPTQINYNNTDHELLSIVKL